MAAGGHSNKAVVVALFANLGVAIAKFVGFFITRSSAMLAEAVHSVADSGNQALLLLGGRRAQREATPQHPFGFGRTRYFYSFVVAVVLFSLGSLFALYEGTSKLREPHQPESLGVALVILGVGIVLEAFAFGTAIKESNKVRGDDSWVEFIRHSRSPELPVVLLEDLGAQVGLIIAFVGVLLAAYVDPIWDAYATIAIGVLLGVIAVVLAIEMKSLLIGEAARPSEVSAIEDALRGSPRVRSLVHLQTQHLGPEELLVAAKIELEGALSVAEVVAAIDETEARIRAAVPAARVIYLEPALPEAAPQQSSA